MRKMRRLLTMLLLALVTTTALADHEGYTMDISLKDGSHAYFVIPKQKPSISCFDGKMVISFRELDSEQESTISFERDLVKDITFAATNGIEPVIAENSRLSFTMASSKDIKVTGLNDADMLRVYSIDGKNVSASISRQDNVAIVSLPTGKRGMYVISVNNSFTFKIVQP